MGGFLFLSIKRGRAGGVPEPHRDIDDLDG
jgi:hypothetical protein